MKNSKLIFIPGWGTNSSIFKEIIEKLKIQSKCIEWGDCLSEDIENNSLYKTLESSVNPVIIAGWSLGGIIALSSSIKYHDRISGLFLISTTARMMEDTNYYGVNESVIKAMIHKLNRKPEEMLKDFFSLCSNKSDYEVSLLLNIATTISKDFLLSGLLYLRNTDIRNELNKIKAPVMIIHGKEDRVINIKNGIYLSEKLPRSEIKILQKEEHLFFHKNPAFLANEISNFMDKYDFR